MSSTAAVVGLGLAAVGLAGRMMVPALRGASKAAKEIAAAGAKDKKAAGEAAAKVMPSMPKMNFDWLPNMNMKFYDKGGFQAEMTRPEAARTLGVGLSSPPDRIQKAHRRLMKILHPDGNGSAYLSMKVNEAKDILLKKRKTGTTR
mmetsp:Transcript_10449/g.26834  ORF Transcript_10449/g.26834 Transcript_10449/m.26834 type:complete len:146 (-) Transcript_10449:150-587(-)